MFLNPRIPHIFQALNDTANRLTQTDHYAADEIETRMETVKIAKENLLLKTEERRSQLEESLSLQQFLRDAEETKNWISEKNKVAGDEAYRNPSNLEVKIQQHQDFEAELQANKGRIDGVVEMARELREAKHFAAEEIQ